MKLIATLIEPDSLRSVILSESRCSINQCSVMINYAVKFPEGRKKRKEFQKVSFVRVVFQLFSFMSNEFFYSSVAKFPVGEFYSEYPVSRKLAEIISAANFVTYRRNFQNHRVASRRTCNEVLRVLHTSVILTYRETSPGVRKMKF